ncbi:2Fe-2S iron-sulfur cluster binding domain-containing protein [Mycolicibacterium llatzerense]|uniref:2Fe-2S iron-sulfur cluster-binding protein n=1 Tax=Mycolicibacterium llatzerense TaxID=280871 RepID=UPI0009E60BD0
MSNASYEVTACIDGHEYSAQWNSGETLLEVLLRRGVEVPYSCQEGHCGACVCRVMQGSVSMINCAALSASDIADGYILPCRAISPAGGVYVSYDD